MTQVKRSVGRYELLEQLGHGGMGVVYLARQTDLGRLVAVKELAAFHGPDRGAAQRFVLEARLAGSLSHPNIVTVHDYFEHEGRPYIAMEYLARGSLRRYMRNLTLAQASGVFEDLLAGLAHAEAERIVHRDLKPENLMVSRDGRIKIADFGIAKALGDLTGGESPTTVSGATVGTPAYMAPEQAIGEQIGPWTDLYALGVIAFELFTGRVPFAGGDMAVMVRHLHDPVPSVSERNPGVHAGIAAWIGRLLVKDPAQRTSSATVAWDELEEIVIEVLGPRWRRNARLGEALEAQRHSGGGASAPDTPPPADLPPGPMMPTEPDVTLGRSTPAWPRRPVAAPRDARPAVRVVAAAGVLCAIGAALLLALLRDGPPAQPGPRLAAANASIRLPPGWRRSGDVGLASRLGLEGAVTGTRAGAPAGGAVTIGRAPPSAHDATLLAQRLRDGLVADPVPSRDGVRDLSSGLEAYRYRALRTWDARPAVTVYAAPTSAGVMTVACAEPTPPDVCDAIARTLRVNGAVPFAIGPSAAYASRVQTSLRTLRRALAQPRTDLPSKSTARSQAAAADAIARALTGARRPLRSFAASPADVAVRDALLASLARASTAYADLARAARNGGRAGYARARARARSAQAAIAAAVQRHVAGGYRALVTEDYRPRAVPALRAPRRTAAATSSAGVAPPPVSTVVPPPPAKRDPVFIP